MEQQKRNQRFINRRATFDYTLTETETAGLVLTGDEVKAARLGRVNLTGSYVKVLFLGGQVPELWLVGANFTGTLDPQRSRKLLVTEAQLKQLIGLTQEKQLTLIPLSLYFRAGRLKLDFAVAKGKKNYDKRQALKEQDLDRQAHRAMK